MNYAEIIGRFHPLIVHLPIGILTLGLLLAAVSRSEKYNMLRPAVSFTLFWGAAGAIGSCVLGYLLSLSGDYNADLLFKHQWTGIGLAVAATGVWALYRFPKADLTFTKGMVWILTTSLLVVAGHYGGSLTHGENYLTELFFKKKKEKIVTPIASDSTQVIQNQIITNENKMPNEVLVSEKNIDLNGEKSLPKTQNLTQNSKNTEGPPSPNLVVKEESKPVMAYQELIQPILEQRCYSCHGPNKSKADLRLDSPDFIKKGGENGSILTVGNPQKSTLYTYLVLPDDDDMHMPPTGKPQLTTEQINLIHAWIEKGGSFDKAMTFSKTGTSINQKTTPSVFQPKSVTNVPTSVPQSTFSKENIAIKETAKLQKGEAQTTIIDRKLEDKEGLILKQKVDSVNAQMLQKFTEQRIIVSKFGEKTEHVMANFVNVKNYDISFLDNLKSIENQLVRLRLSNQPVKDDDLKKVAALKNITRLNLEKTLITDAGLAHLKDMPNLEQLNIYGTNITDKGLAHLSNCKSLKVLYLWGTKTTPQGIENLQKILRGLQIDTGGVKFIKQDSTKKG
jgi:Planctomycete cytochrome C